MCEDTWRRLDADFASIIGSLEVVAVSPAVTPTAAFGEGISALSDEAVCYPGSLWSAFTAACPRLWRSRQDTRPSVATGLPDDSNGALREAVQNRVGARPGEESDTSATAATGHEGGEAGRAHSRIRGNAVVLRFRKEPATGAAGQVTREDDSQSVTVRTTITAREAPRLALRR